MKKIVLMIVLSILMLSCGGDFDPDYMVEKPKVLGVSISNPEVAPAESFRVKLLVAGSTVDQDMNIPVYWMLGDRSPVISTYTRFAEVPVPEKSEEGEYTLLGITEIDGKKLAIQKRVRVKKNSNYIPSKIKGIELVHGNKKERVENGKIHFNAAGAPDYFALRAIVDNKIDPSIGKVIYRWKITKSKKGNGELYVSWDDDEIAKLLGSDADANQYKDQVVISIRGEEGDDGIQKGEYDLFLIIRDKAEGADERSQDLLGMDYMHVKVVID